MAIQTGDITLSGKLGDQVHYRRKKKNVTRKAPKKYNMSEGSKKAGSEFGRASTAAALIRKGFASLVSTVNTAGDDGLVNRINSKVLQVIATGPQSKKGSRTVTDGDVDLLTDTELNPQISMGSVFPVKAQVTVHPLDGVCVTLPAFEPEKVFGHKYKTSVEAVIGITSCTFNFPEKNGRFAIAEDLVLPLKGASFPGGTLEFPLDTMDERILITGMMVYFRSADGQIIDNRRYKAACLIKAALVRNGEIIPFVYPEEGQEPAPQAAASNAKIAWKIKKSSADDTETTP